MRVAINKRRAMIKSPNLSETQKLPAHGEGFTEVRTSRLIPAIAIGVVIIEFALAISMAREIDQSHQRPG